MYSDKLSSIKRWRFWIKIFLYVENDLSTSTEIIGVDWRTILNQVSLLLLSTKH